MAKFGESFVINTENTLEALKKSEKTSDSLRFSNRVRTSLGETFKDHKEWPKAVESWATPEELMEACLAQTDEIFRSRVYPIFEEQCLTWRSQIADTEETQEMRQLLATPGELYQRITVRNFGVAEPLRQILPEAWTGLLQFSAERQSAYLTLLRHWLKDIPEEDFIGKGITKTEMELALDASSLLGKFIEHAHYKQIALADAPGGSAKTKLRKQEGAEYIYDIPSSDPGDQSVKRYSYAEVFPVEFEQLSKNCGHLADKVDGLLESGRLSNSYNHLSVYLRALSEWFASRETDLEKKEKQYAHLNELFLESAYSDCGVIIVPPASQSVAGDANKIDNELIVAIKSIETRQLETIFKQMITATQDLRSSGSGKKWFDIRPGIAAFDALASYGSQQYYSQRANADGSDIAISVNNIKTFVQKSSLPLIKKVCPDYETNETALVKLAVLDTGAHEIGHCTREGAVVKNLDAAEYAIIYEYTADITAIRLIYEHYEQSGQMDELRDYFFSRLADICVCLRNRSSQPGTFDEAYFVSSAVIIDQLFKEGIVVQNDGHYEVRDFQKGLQILIKMSEQIMDDLQLNEQLKLEQARDYVKKLRAASGQDDVRKFIAFLKALPKSE